MKITKKEILRQNISRLLLLAALVVVPSVASAASVNFYANFGGSNSSGYNSGSYNSSSYTSGSYGSGAPSCTQQSLCSLVVTAVGYFNQAIYLIIALAVVTFVWNIYKYFIVSDPENKKEASKYVMYSVIGLFVILSFWGLVNIVSNTLNLNTNPGAIDVQSLTGSGSGGSGGTPVIPGQGF